MAEAIITETYSQIMAVCMNIHINVCVSGDREKSKLQGIEDSFYLLYMKCCLKGWTFILYQKMFPIIMLVHRV